MNWLPMGSCYQKASLKFELKKGTGEKCKIL